MKFRISRKTLEIKKFFLVIALDIALAALIANLFFTYGNKYEAFFFWLGFFLLVPLAFFIKDVIYSFFVFKFITKEFFEREIYVLLKNSNLPRVDGHYFYEPYQYFEELLKSDTDCETKQKACMLLGYFRGIIEGKSEFTERMMFESCLRRSTEKYLSEV